MFFEKIFFPKIVESYKSSGALMEKALFKPLNFKLWLKLGFLSFFNQLPFFLFLFILNFLIIPLNFLKGSKIFPLLPHIFLTFPFLFFLFLLLFSIFLYFSGFSQYFYLEFALNKRKTFNEFSKDFKNLTRDYFILNFFLYTLFSFSFISFIFLFLLFKEVFSTFFLSLTIFLFLFIHFFILTIIKDIYIPVSYIKKFNLKENLFFSLKIFSEKPLYWFFYIFLKLILVFILSTALIFMGFLTFGILFILFLIPIFGQAILQPIIYFLTLFGLNFLKNFEGMEKILEGNA